MSEPTENEIKPPTAEEIKARAEANNKAASEALAKRVAELKLCEGKTYRPKAPARGFENQTVLVEKYEGIAAIDPTGKTDARNAANAHIFLAESSNPDFRWKPACTKFLEEFVEITVTETATNNEVL